MLLMLLLLMLFMSSLTVSGHEMPRKVDVAEENQERRESESFSEGASLVDVEAKAQQLLKKPWISKSEMNTLLTQALRGKMLPENGRKVDRCSRAQGAKGLTLGFYVYGKNVGVTKADYAALLSYRGYQQVPAAGCARRHVGSLEGHGIKGEHGTA